MLNLNHKKSIIWDWNGTLLDDAQFCVDCMNKVLLKHNIRSIDIDIYRSHFTFPVKDYYRAIGFDFNIIDFEVPAMEFIEEYYSNIGKVKLHNEAINMLSYFRNKGISQFVLSAMEHGELIKSLTDKGIIEFFETIHGINNHYAHSKVELGKEMMNKLMLRNDEVLLIGDTIHDYEVATELGIDCILVSVGHQSTSRLKEVTPNIVDGLENIKDLFQTTI